MKEDDSFCLGRFFSWKARINENNQMHTQNTNHLNLLCCACTPRTQQKSYLKILGVQSFRWVQVLHDVGKETSCGRDAFGARTGGFARRARPGALHQTRAIDAGRALALLVSARAGAVGAGGHRTGDHHRARLHRADADAPAGLPIRHRRGDLWVAGLVGGQVVAVIVVGAVIVVSGRSGRGGSSERQGVIVVQS